VEDMLFKLYQKFTGFAYVMLAALWWFTLPTIHWSIPVGLVVLSEMLQRNVLGKFRDMDVYRPVPEDKPMCHYTDNLLTLDVGNVPSPFMQGFYQGSQLYYPLRKLLWRFLPVYLALKWFRNLDA